MSSLSKTRKTVYLLGIGLFSAFLFYSIFFTPPTQVHFSSVHKAEIQLIADRLCAAARQQNCIVTWGGKNRWFGYLEPSQGYASIDLASLRGVLDGPEWSEETKTNGVQFTGSAYEVFYSSPSERIVITNREVHQ